jgi:hypothetical protein
MRGRQPPFRLGYADHASHGARHLARMFGIRTRAMRVVSRQARHKEMAQPGPFDVTEPRIREATRKFRARNSSRVSRRGGPGRHEDRRVGHPAVVGADFCASERAALRLTSRWVATPATCQGAAASPGNTVTGKRTPLPSGSQAPRLAARKSGLRDGKRRSRSDAGRRLLANGLFAGSGTGLIPPRLPAPPPTSLPVCHFQIWRRVILPILSFSRMSDRTAIWARPRRHAAR